MQEIPDVSTKSGGPLSRLSAGSLAMTVLLASISMLFGASIVGYLITRAQNPVWRTAGMPGLPVGLILSTAVIALVSFAAAHAVAASRRNNFEALERWLWLVFGSAVAFLLAQAFNWREMMAAQASVSERTLYEFTFYMLTGLHAAHIVAGFVPLAVVMRNARMRKYSSSSNEGLRLCRRYWDYLGVVWVVLLTVMYLAT